MGCFDSRDKCNSPANAFVTGGRATIGGANKFNKAASLKSDSNERLPMGKPKKKTNQDRLISSSKVVDINPSVGDSFQAEIKLYGVCDGHGEFGAEVAQFIASKLPGIIYDCFTNEYQQGLNSVNSLLHESVSIVRKGLKAADVDTQFSGCTVLLCLIFEGTLYTCNLGDSRAVLGFANSGNLQAEALSKDAIPSDPNHQRRIMSKGGLVSLDTMNNPVMIGRTPTGNQMFRLGMATSMGDTWASNFGLSHRPDITERKLTGEELFIVLGSDGIWGVYSNEEITALCYKGLMKESNVDTVCMQIAYLCCEQWAERYERVDDVSLIILLLKDLPSFSKNLKPCADVELRDVTHGARNYGTLRSVSPQSFMSNTIRWRYVVASPENPLPSSPTNTNPTRLFMDMDPEAAELSLTSDSLSFNTMGDVSNPTLDRMDSCISVSESVGIASVCLDYLDIKSIKGMPRSPYSHSRSWNLEIPDASTTSKILDALQLQGVTPQNSRNSGKFEIPDSEDNENGAAENSVTEI